MQNNFSILNVYQKKNKKSQLVTQLIYGDRFKIKKKESAWFKIKNDLDNYQGYIKKNKFPLNSIQTHKVSKTYVDLYRLGSKKNKLKKKLYFGSKLRIKEKKGKFYKFDNYWINKKNVENIKTVRKNPFFNIKKFLGIKYKWGGKNYKGMDCSALVQLLLNYNNQFCPRDTKDQIIFFKKNINIKNIKKNDLIFWKGHVAVALSKKKLIHAYGPEKKVVIMPIKKTIEKIYKTAGLKVIAIKRIV